MRQRFLALLLVIFVLWGCQSQSGTAPEAKPTQTSTGTAHVPTLTPTLTDTPRPRLQAHPPVLLALHPQPGEEVPVDTTLSWRFDQAIDRETFARALRISPLVEGELIWTAPDHVTLRPVTLSPATRYVVSLDDVVRSSQGLTISAPLRYGFFTVTPLSVTQVSPGDGAMEVRADAPIVVDFNRPIVPVNCVGQDADDALCPALPLTFAPPVTGHGMWLTTSRYRFEAAGPMVAGESYWVSLDATVMSVDGQSLETPYEWGFQTAAPRVVDISPGNGETGILLDVPVYVTFNTPMDQARTGAAFRMESETGDAVPGTISWKDHGTVLVYSPTVRLALGRTYRVQIGESARAAASTPLENPMVWSFTTVESPKLLGFSPANGSETFGINVPIQLRFAGAIEPSTLEASVEISPSVDLEQRYGYFDPEEGAYYLSWDREPRTRYCITVTTSLSDIYGNHLREPAAFCFMTDDLPPLLEPVTPGQTLTLSSQEPAEVFFLARNVTQVTFRLYQLDLATFVQSEPAIGEPLRTWTQSFALPLNEPQGATVTLRRFGGALPTGLYRLTWQLPNERYEHHLDIAVIGRHLTLKHASRQSLAWLTDLRTGRPISQTAVRLIDHDGLLVAGAATDEHGLAWLYAAPQETLWSPVAAVCGEPGEPGFGFTMSSWQAEANPWESGVDFDGGPWSPYRVFLQTDRPIYRPGQGVFFSAFVREFDTSLGYLLPRPGGEITVTLHDPMWAPVYTETLPIPQRGHFAGQIALRDDLLTGVYHLVVTARAPEASRVLEVADIDLAIVAYRKPVYSLEISPSVTATVQGNPVRFALKTEYYAGGAVTDADVKWSVYAEPTYFKPGNGYSPWQWSAGSLAWGRTLVAQGHTRTDAHGQATVALTTRLAGTDGAAGEGLSGPQMWTFEAVVQDESGTSVASRAQLVVHPAGVYVGLRPQSWVVEAKRRLTVDVLVLDHEGHPVYNSPVHVTLSQRTWQAPTVPGGVWHYTDTLIAEQDVIVDPTEPTAVEFRVPSAGLYVVAAETTDASGYLAQSEVSIWAGGAGTGALLWRPTNGRLELVPDARRYQVGDVARILVPIDASKPYELLLTVEREGVLMARHMHLTTPNPVLEVPILETRPGYAPNVFVSVVLISEGDPVAKTQVGYTMLEVDPSPYLLSVELVSDRDIYQPGESALLTIRTRDVTGQPVPADVILAVVDPAVLSLRRDTSQSIRDVFYGRRPLAVLTGDAGLMSLSRVRADVAQWLSILEAQAQGLGKGGGGAGEGAGFDVRSDFPDTAFWLSRVSTDESGVAKVVVPLPDSLTPWVVRAWAISAADHASLASQPAMQVGDAQTTLRVWKPLAVEALLPRFLVVGDSTTVGAMVHNNTDVPLSVSVSLTVPPGIVSPGSLTHQVLVPAAQGERVIWPIEVDEDAVTTVAAMLISAETQSYSDAVQRDISIRRYTTTSLVGSAGILEGPGARTEAVIVPSGAGPHTSLTLRVDTSLVGPLRSAVSNMLTPFPRPTDAWVSSLLPTVVSLQALQAIDPTEVDSDSYAPVHEALEHVYARQNADGGWGWWYGPSEPRLTLYTCLGLLRARDAGIGVRTDVIDGALRYIQRVLSQDLGDEPKDAQLALGAYLLASADKPLPKGVGSALYESRSQLGISGRALLAMALAAVDARDPRVVTLLEEIRSAAIVSGSGAYWDEESPRTWTTPIQTTATVVEALSTLAPRDSILPHAVRWLMLMRSSDLWHTSYESAWAVLALADYVLASGEIAPDYVWTLAFNGQTVVSEAPGGEGSLSLSFGLAESSASWSLHQGLNVFAVERGAGRGKFYYNARLSVETPLEALADPVSRGLDIERHYCKVSLPVDPETLLDFGQCEPATSVSVGDVVLVRLNVIAHDSVYYVRVMDPYPGGFMALDPLVDIAPSQRTSRRLSWLSGGGDLRLPGDFEWQDLRDDEAHFYARKLSAGLHEAVYLLQATAPGAYTSLPARVEVIHFPEIWGRTGVAQLTVLDRSFER